MHTREYSESRSEPVLVDVPAGEDTAEDICLIVHPGVQMTFVETDFHSNITVQVGAGAQVQYVVAYSGAGHMRKQAVLDRDAQWAWRSALLGGEHQMDIVTLHNGPGASSDHRGIFIGRERDKMAMNYWSEHTAPHTSGHIMVHGALFDRAYADFKGNIKIAQTASATDGSLTEAALLLGDHARSDSIPQLEIDTNDVQAAHSSSITRVDDEQLFYLQSRMIPYEEGKRMIVRGFLESIIDTFAVETVRQEIYTMIDERIQYV